MTESETGHISQHIQYPFIGLVPRLPDIFNTHATKEELDTVCKIT